MRIQFSILIAFLLLQKLTCAQVISNSDLVGIVNFDNAPNNWQMIPISDPACLADTFPEATVDILDTTGPSLSGGVAGMAYSGSTFCSGLHAASSGLYLWHEGIMQTVDGFTPGEEYQLSFYQTVVKQNNCLDQSGSWRVYLDDVLLNTTLPSASNLGPTDLNLIWENRQLSFTASSTTHTLKFIPWDDDGNIETSYSDISGALRMGIDKIEIIVIDPNPPIVNLGNDTTLCQGDSLLLDATFSGASYLWSDGSTDSTLFVNETGVYWVNVSNEDGNVTDTIQIDFLNIPNLNLQDTLFKCPDDTLHILLEPNDNNLMWQDGSQSMNYAIYNSGTYILTESNQCGSDTDSIVVIELDCTPLLEMPNVFTPNNDELNDFYLPIINEYLENPELTILNRWGQIVYQTNNLQLGWDGKFNDTECSESVYFWIITYQMNGVPFKEHGMLHLIR